MDSLRRMTVHVYIFGQIPVESIMISDFTDKFEFAIFVLAYIEELSSKTAYVHITCSSFRYVIKSVFGQYDSVVLLFHKFNFMKEYLY